jgi:hypothetical protein
MGHHANSRAASAKGSLPAQAGWTGSARSPTMRPGSNGGGGMRIGTGNPGRLDRPERRVGAASTSAAAWTLTAAYERCRQLHARHGRTSYLATLLLPGWKRRHVHALYGFTRYARRTGRRPRRHPGPVRRAAALRAGATLLLMGQGELAAWAVVEDGGASASRCACWMSWPSRSTARW